jgi:predicted porin
MQKKLIVLAVAALASGAAFAQSNVTIYGTVDLGFAHRGDNVERHVSSQNAINSGQAATSLIGFKGVEDLGNGTSALFVLEAGFQADDGTHDQLFSEQAFLGLTGGWGTAIAGRLVAPRHGFLSAIDPFGAGTVGQYRNVFNDTTLGIFNVPLADVDRVDNAVAYVSPSYSGFNVTVAYATHGLAQEGTGVPVNQATATALGLPTTSLGASIDNDSDAKVFTVLPRYTNGPLDVGLVYQLVKIDDALPEVDETDVKLKQWSLGASYDFGPVKLGAFYDDFKTNAGDVAATLGLDDIRLKTWLIGATVPFGKHAVLASYSQSKLKQNGYSGKSKQWALGYTYDLSKRTSFYAAYADINNDDGRGADVGDSSNVGDGYQNGFQFGLKHSF